jgi:hypothetical protein
MIGPPDSDNIEIPGRKVLNHNDSIIQKVDLDEIARNQLVGLMPAGNLHIPHRECLWVRRFLSETDSVTDVSSWKT